MRAFFTFEDAAAIVLTRQRVGKTSFEWRLVKPLRQRSGRLISAFLRASGAGLHLLSKLVPLGPWSDQPTQLKIEAADSRQKLSPFNEKYCSLQAQRKRRSFLQNAHPQLSANSSGRNSAPLGQVGSAISIPTSFHISDVNIRE
jgi:hypothetical protein